eukprot:6757025-Alexandrium_andersonii.AAC.1
MSASLVGSEMCIRDRFAAMLFLRGSQTRGSKGHLRALPAPAQRSARASPVASPKAPTVRA